MARTARFGASWFVVQGRHVRQDRSLKLQPPQPQRIQDHGDRTERHGCVRDYWAEHQSKRMGKERPQRSDISHPRPAQVTSASDPTEVGADRVTPALSIPTSRRLITYRLYNPTSVTILRQLDSQKHRRERPFKPSLDRFA